MKHLLRLGYTCTYMYYHIVVAFRGHKFSGFRKFRNVRQIIATNLLFGMTY